MHALNIFNKGDALLFQEISEVTERERVPFNCLRAVVLTAMIENVLFNGRTNSPFRAQRNACQLVQWTLQEQLARAFCEKNQKIQDISNSLKAVT